MNKKNMWIIITIFIAIFLIWFFGINQKHNYEQKNIVDLNNQEYSFIKLDANYPVEKSIFSDAVDEYYYNDMKIYTADNKEEVDFYNCDKSFQSRTVNQADPEFENNGGCKVEPEKCKTVVVDNPSYYCKTNGKDYVERIEFITPDFDGDSKWEKVYIKKINDVDVIFTGLLFGEGYNFLESPSKESKELVQRIESKKYLDDILKDSKNIEKIKGWDKVVSSFDIKK